MVTPRGLLPSCFFLAAPSRGPWDTKWTESPLPEGGEHWTLFPRFCISRCYGVVPSVLLKLPCSTTPLVRSPSNAPTSVPSARVDLGPAGNASEQREEAASLSSGERLGGSCHEGPGTPARLCHVNFSQVVRSARVAAGTLSEAQPPPPPLLPRGGGPPPGGLPGDGPQLPPAHCGPRRGVLR